MRVRERGQVLHPGIAVHLSRWRAYFAWNLPQVCTTSPRAARAEKSGVSDRVDVGALFRPEDFAAYAGQEVLVLCDIEGAARELLDPGLLPGITPTLIERFTPTHHITLVQDDGQRQLQNAPPWFHHRAHLDQRLATRAWRSGPTPWLVMRAGRPAESDPPSSLVQVQP